jgi:hypothetical protein
MFLFYCGVGSLPSITSVVQTMGWMVQRFPVVTAVVSSMFCVELQCLAERSHLKTGDVFPLLNPHLGGHQFHNNMEVEIAVL